MTVFSEVIRPENVKTWIDGKVSTLTLVSVTAMGEKVLVVIDGTV